MLKTKTLLLCQGFLAFYLKYLMIKLQATKDISFLSPPLGGQLQEESRTAVEPDGYARNSSKRESRKKRVKTKVVPRFLL